MRIEVFGLIVAIGLLQAVANLLLRGESSPTVD